MKYLNLYLQPHLGLTLKKVDKGILCCSTYFVFPHSSFLIFVEIAQSDYMIFRSNYPTPTKTFFPILGIYSRDSN